MDGLAFNALAALKGGVPTDTKLKLLTELKAEIKHRQCPESAVAPLFDVVRASISTPHLADAGFSILSHLTKRLIGQDQILVLQTQGVKTYPCLLERLADSRDRIRSRAAQALTDFHAIAAPDVEQFVRDKVLTCKNPKAKEVGMQWVASTRKERNIAFRAFVPNIVDCLEDADGNVRKTAQETIVELFQNAGLRGMNDLQKHLQQRNVRRTIIDHIQSELGVAASVELEVAPEINTPVGGLPKQTLSVNNSAANDPPLHTPTMSVSEQEAVQLDPIYIESARDLEEVFREMHPWFEGKESEGNWLKREKSILKLRKITKGNAPQDFTTLYLSNIKALLDGILKTVNSLRTTVSTIGCHLVQDIARVAGPGLDNMVEILLQNLIKLCANTKKITATKANETVAAIMANVSYHVRIMQHIHGACQDKNVQPRNFACGWLKTIINKHGNHKSAIEHSGGLDLIEKCLKLGLADRDKNVRDGMRPTYWAYARRWPERSEILLSFLETSQQKLLIEDSSNPNPQKASNQVATTAGKPAFSKSTSAASTRPSIKETIAAQKRAKAAGRIPERPSSAEPSTSPKKSTIQPTAGRPGAAMSSTSRNVSNTSVGTLSSAPVRPRRRADVARPATADPYSSRKPTRTETPPRSPGVSPVKRVKTPAPPASSAKLALRKVESPASSRGNSPRKNGVAEGPSHYQFNSAIVQPQPSPTKAAEDFTMVMPSLKSSRSEYNLSSQPANFEDPFMGRESSEVVGSASPDKTFKPRAQTSPNNRGGGIPRLSPSKLASSFGRLSIDEDKNQRISMSPRPIGSRKENLTPKNSNIQDQKPLQVYEDPIRSPNNGSLYPSPLAHTVGALEELPVNEPTKQRGLFEPQFLAEEPKSPGYHQKWLAVEARERQRTSTSENIENPILARKILGSGIERVRARSLDVHGFRKLQTLIRSSGDTIWEDGYKFDELLPPLLDYLETPNDDSAPRSGKAHDLKTQVLVTVRLLLQYQPKYFFSYYPRALTAVLSARKHYSSTSHIVSGLEETAESIVHRCDPLPCIDSVLDLLEIERTQAPGSNPNTDTMFMGLYVLAGLLHRGQEKGSNSFQLSTEQEQRLGRMGASCLADTNPDVRRAVMEFVVELHDKVEKERFWGLVARGRDDHRSLITYYLARKRAVVMQ